MGLEPQRLRCVVDDGHDSIAAGSVYFRVTAPKQMFTVPAVPQVSAQVSGGGRRLCATALSPTIEVNFAIVVSVPFETVSSQSPKTPGLSRNGNHEHGRAQRTNGFGDQADGSGRLYGVTPWATVPLPGTANGAVDVNGPSSVQQKCAVGIHDPNPAGSKRRLLSFMEAGLRPGSAGAFHCVTGSIELGILT